MLAPLQTASRYQNLVSGAEEVESCLGACFAEHLNAEIVLQTVRTVDQAFLWLKTTFLYIRVRGVGRGGIRCGELRASGCLAV